MTNLELKDAIEGCCTLGASSMVTNLVSASGSLAVLATVQGGTTRGRRQGI